MLILALDSAALSASVAVCRDETLLAECTIQAGLTHSETLLPLTEACLAAVGLRTDDVDLFAATTGPGSFTGTRIGAATVKGLAFGRGKPCVGVSALSCLAQNGAVSKGLVCPVMDARRERVYNALFLSDGRGNVRRLCPDRLVPIADLGGELAETSGEILLTGDGSRLVYAALGGALGPRLRPLPERWLRPSAYAAAQLARARYGEGVRTTDAEFVPVYLRPTKAERDLRARQAALGPDGAPSP